MKPMNPIQASALQPVSAKRGSIYETVQADLDFHAGTKFPSRNPGPFISSDQATKELILHNDAKRQVPREERAAINRILDLVNAVERGYKWGPDLALKCFADLDLVLFGGKLRGNVRVRWVACAHSLQFRALLWHRDLGVTEHPRPGERGQCCIVLNTDAILDGYYSLWRFRLIFSTLLHEMCHAYFFVRCGRHLLSSAMRMGERPHGEHFCARISAVHRRAEGILKLEAVDDWEPYLRPHRLADEDEGGYLACGDGQVVFEGGGRGEDEKKCVLM